MKLWFNIESGIELKKYTIEAGLYLTQWQVKLIKTRGGLTTLQLGPLWVSVFDNERLMNYYNEVIENNPYGPRDED